MGDHVVVGNLHTHTARIARRQLAEQLLVLGLASPQRGHRQVFFHQGFSLLGNQVKPFLIGEARHNPHQRALEILRRELELLQQILLANLFAR